MAVPRPAPPIPTPLRELRVRVPGLATAQLVGDPETLVTGVSLDSRTVQPGDLYAALPGANTHGAQFAAQAGVAAVLTDPAGLALLDPSARPVLVVDNPREVLGAVASVLYGTTNLPMRLVGVTGTNGKTTTAYLIDSALRALGVVTGMIGTVETRIGPERLDSARTTPEATDLHALLAVMADRGVEVCVMEVSSHALAQHRVDGVRYEVAAFTNLSQDHLDYHRTMEDYFAAKALLFTPEHSTRGIICTDDEWGKRLAESAGIPVQTVAETAAPGRATWCVVAPAPIESGTGSEADQPFDLIGEGTRLALRRRLPGDFNTMNTAVAALVLHSLGYPDVAIEAAIAVEPTVPGRMEVIRPSLALEQAASDARPLVVVDYAHTPRAVAAALLSLRPRVTGQLVVVLGAGGDRDRGKRAAMGAAAAEHADLVIVTDDNPRSEDPAAIRAALLAGARALGSGAELVETGPRAEAIEQAVRQAARTPGSIVAIVGKGHETGQEVAGSIHPFDDRVEARRALDSLVDGPVTS